MFHINSEVTIPEGKLEEFKDALRAQMAKMAEAETRTHSYVAYISSDGKRCQVDQYYEDEAAFIDHLKASAAGLRDALDGTKEDFRYWIYNDIESPEVKEIIPKIATLDLLVVGSASMGYKREASGGPVTWIGA
ncbi:putative quinol monooxygenase, partial [Rhodococcus sp. 3A]